MNPKSNIQRDEERGVNEHTSPNLTSGLLVRFWLIFQATCTWYQCLLKDTLPLTFTYTRQETLNLHETFSSGKLCYFWVPTTLFPRVQPCFVSFNVEFINSLSPAKSDQHQISPRNINALLNRVDVKIMDMITQDEFAWYFINFSLLLL